MKNTPARKGLVSFLVVTVGILALLLCFNSCKKTDAGEEVTNKNTPPAWMIEEIRKKGTSFSVSINKKSEAVYLDQDEKEISAARWGSRLEQARLIPCDATEDDFLDNTFLLGSAMFRYFTSGSVGYQMEVSYQVHTAFDIALANPANPSQLTRGRLRIKDFTTGNILYNYTSLPIGANDIEYLGTDPYDPDKKIYNIKFSTPLITDQNFGLQNIVVEIRPIVYSDCEEVIITPGNWDIAHWGAMANDVCARVDDITINPSGSGVYIFGCNAVSPSVYPAGVSVPNQHDIGYRPIEASEEEENYIHVQTIYPLGGCYTNDYFGQMDVMYLTGLSSGTYIFRYRNIKHNNSLCAPDYDEECFGPYQYKTVTIP